LNNQIIISIEYISSNKKSIGEFIKNVKEKKYENNGISNLKQNQFFINLFGYTANASVICHEIEHARRRSYHTASGAHEQIEISFFGEPKKMYHYDDGANKIYEKLASDGLITDWLEKITEFI